VLATLVTVPSSAEDRLAACALADFTLRKAAAAGFERKTQIGWEFVSEVRKASLFCKHRFRENVPAVTNEVPEQRT
jgi:hypothetical protein